MKRFATALLLLSLSASALAKTHKDSYTIPCPTLWAAVKDTLRNSGKYGIISIANDELHRQARQHRSSQHSRHRL